MFVVSVQCDFNTVLPIVVVVSGIRISLIESVAWLLRLVVSNEAPVVEESIGGSQKRFEPMGAGSIPSIGVWTDRKPVALPKLSRLASPRYDRADEIAIWSV